MKLPKVYEPGQYEADIYALWEKSEAFVAVPTSDKERFSISMPPPNETGTLSLGHALFLTLQDIMARHARQQGKDVLWLPGTDHAALAVNALIEKKLANEGTDKHSIGRDEFLRITKEFVADSRGTMLNQMRAMGASCDWSRLRYTLDDALNRCVNEVFIKMYNDDLIYRGHRIVNWDPNLETTVSDDEVVYKQETAKFYTFKYGPFEISTARPETKFGDKYVVMHPDDKRYKQYKHGDTFEAEWINGKVMATVIKDEAVNPEFGTGVMTITPWHDHTDFEIAERHGLDKEQIIDFHGKLLPVAGEFAGMPIHDARPKIVDKLKGKGLLVSVDNSYIHNVAINDRGKGVIEPQIKLQWFVDVNKPVVDWKGKQRSLKEVMQSVVREGDIAVIPKRFEKIYFHWIDNLRDWCISRQIWWGHRIPVWYRTHADGQTEMYAGLTPPVDDESEGWHEWEQDSDTLDTWFSSALWTWSTLIDPKLAGDYSLSLQDLLDKSPDFQAYHPTTVMETGWDILFFWVARMILSTTYATGQVPFKTVYLHGLIRAEDGKKMSKSRPESIIDPLDVIPKYGTDALRMALVMGVTPGNDQNWGWGKIEANRNFCNKLWNIARYIEGKVGDDYHDRTPQPESAADHWLLTKLQHVTDKIDGDLNNFRFAEAYETLYHFVWDEFADWYIEASKAEPNIRLLAFGLETVLQLTHPFAPFVTETIWQTLRWEDATLLISSSWPTIPTAKRQISREFEDIKTMVSEIRFIVKALKVNDVRLCFSDDPFLETNADLIKQLSRIKEVIEVPGGQGGVRLTQTSHNVWLDIDEQTAQKYVGELEAKKDNIETQIGQLKARLENKAYVQNAPADIVDETKQSLRQAEALLTNIEQEQARFSTN